MCSYVPHLICSCNFCYIVKAALLSEYVASYYFSSVLIVILFPLKLIKSSAIFLSCTIAKLASHKATKFTFIVGMSDQLQKLQLILHMYYKKLQTVLQIFTLNYRQNYAHT